MSAKNNRRLRRLPASISNPFERLETRACMAGDVALLLGGNVLTVVGNAAGNQIRIEQVAPQSFLITGLEDTTVNGKASETVAFNGDDLRINLKGGDDHLEIVGSLSERVTLRKLSIDLGAGSDTADLSDVDVQGTTPVDMKLAKVNHNDEDTLTLFRIRTNGSVNVTMGAGNDRVQVKSSSVEEDFKVRLQGGDDEFSGDIHAHDFQVLGAGGDDSIELASVIVRRDLKIVAGKGVDNVAVGGDDGFAVIERNATILGGDGDDTILVRAGFEDVRIVEGNLTINAGKGNDDLTVGGVDDAVTVAGTFSVDAGIGDDRLLLEEVEAGTAMVDFRGGRSDLTANDVLVTGKVTLKGGNSTNSIALNRMVAADLEINYAKGTTNAELADVTAAAVAIATGKAIDTVSIRQSVLGRVFAQFGGGDDILAVEQLTSNQTEIESGDGNDRLTLTGVFVAVKGSLTGDLKIRGMNGDDHVAIHAVAAAGTLLDGGAGEDTLDEGNVLFKSRVVKGIEVLQ